MGCPGDAHCPLKCVAMAVRWSVSFLCVQDVEGVLLQRAQIETRLFKD